MLQTVLLVFHIFVAIALVCIIVVFQRSEGGGLGLGSSGGSGSFMSARGSANFITRLTGIFAGLFMLTSLALAILAGNHGQGTSILDQLPAGPAAPAPATTAPATPEVPLSK
jgi:preprotein translocase subunit SecG